MSTDSRSTALLGRVFLWGGIVLGLVLVGALLTRGFGLLAAPPSAGGDAPTVLHRADKVIVPEGSPLRERLLVVPAPSESVSAKVELPGVVEADPARTAAVLSPLSGRVVDQKVALGDRVTQGQVLAVIDSPDLAQAYDDDEKAADSFELTRRKLERQEGQFKIGAASDQDLDQARSDHAQAAAEYARTQARLKVLGMPADAKDRSALLAVKAPIGGSVTALSIARGNMINDPTQPLMTIADLSTVWVTALVAEKDLGSVAKNQDAEVSLAAYPGWVLHGKVLFISDVIEPDSRRNKLRIAFANAGYELKPNMFATVVVYGPKRTRTVLPTSALLINNDRTSVFVATAPWTFERRSVETLLEEGTSVTIRSGVEAGEQVVVKGGILLND
ncbi:MAG TPA: efflux RND transporter periplasmic adaptor subunit [Burkholderiaceae bacterium]|nr:efflux RND transporter periplasmic adaptor subunit [Burkholderiaceae bacterium]